MNIEEVTTSTTGGVTITVRSVPINYVGPKDKAPKYIEVETDEKKEAVLKARLLMSKKKLSTGEQE